MIAALAFTLVAFLLVHQAGRRDAAHDPRLTIGLLALTVLVPVFGMWMPKIEVLPSASVTSTEASLPWAMWLFTIWGIGFLWQSLRLAAAVRTVRAWIRNSREIQRIHDVSIRVCESLDSPVAVGILRKAVLVPAAWSEWPEECRRIVLEHELAHHVRRDPLWRFLSAMACAVHWYQPMVHWMARRFVVQSEFACDAAVLRGGIAPKAYAKVLCDVAANTSASPLAAAMAERTSLESRVCRMMTATPSARSAVSLAALALLGLLAACSLAMMARKPLETRTVPTEEVELRLSANPFPGNP